MITHIASSFLCGSVTLPQLMHARLRLDVRIHKKAHQVFKKGTRVTWDHNGYGQEGVVYAILGLPGSTRVGVKNVRTGCMRQLTLWQVVK